MGTTFVVVIVFVGCAALIIGWVLWLKRSNRIEAERRTQKVLAEMSTVGKLIHRHGPGPFFLDDAKGDKAETLLRDIELRTYKITNRHEHIGRGLCDYSQVHREFSDMVKDSHERMGFVDQLIEQFFPESVMWGRADGDADSTALAREGWGVATAMGPFRFWFYRV